MSARRLDKYAKRTFVFYLNLGAMAVVFVLTKLLTGVTSCRTVQVMTREVVGFSQVVCETDNPIYFNRTVAALARALETGELG
jgi:hypothetical protein